MILDEIVNKTKERVLKSKEIKNFDKLRAEVSLMTAVGEDFPFEKALKNKDMAFICEVKKASPSKGIIAGNFDYLKIAKEYEQAGAAAISVLTEPDFFMGDNKYLKEIADNVKIPVLRKDFIIDAYQIYEAKLIGASAILLICSILDAETLEYFMSVAEKLGLSVLTETHDEKEVKSALKAGAKIIGVNNRNLKTFEVDIKNSLKLRNLIPENIIFVSESGIKTPCDIKLLKDAKTNAVLIGETFMTSPDKKESFRYLRSLL